MALDLSLSLIHKLGDGVAFRMAWCSLVQDAIVRSDIYKTQNNLLTNHSDNWATITIEAVEYAFDLG